MPRRVLIATFAIWNHKKRTAINGMIEPMLTYFLPKTDYLDLIDGPHPGSDCVASIFERYEAGTLKNKQISLAGTLMTPLLSVSNHNSTQAFFKIRDILAVFEMAVRTRKKYDLFIGIESAYTLAGIVLKKLGIVKTVAYYVSDYSPDRYHIKTINAFYLWLDRLCCYHADYVWDVSRAMLPARKAHGLDVTGCAPVIHVPNALFDEQIDYLPESKITKNTLVFAGTLGDINGPGLIIEALPKIIKQIPDIHYHIIGGDGENEVKLQKLVKKLNLSSYVTFHGFIVGAAAVSKLSRQFAVGVAPYRAIPGSPRWYADATKIRLYMGAGQPVITTQVPPLGRELEKLGCVVVTNDTKEDIAEAVIHMLKDQKVYRKMRACSIAYAKTNTWENTYTTALSKMHFEKNKD